MSEIIRSRRTTITRAAEISSLVLNKMDEIQSEKELLVLLNNLEKEFEEVLALKEALHFGHSSSDVKIYDKEIRQYAADHFIHDAAGSAAFLQVAGSPGLSIQELCLKYPEFCHYLLYNSDKSNMLNKLQTA